MELVGMLRVLWRQRPAGRRRRVDRPLGGSRGDVSHRLPAEAREPPIHGRRRLGVRARRYPSSQIVDLGGKTGADIGTLSARASLLASLMTSSPIKDEIASRAGVSPDELIAVSPAAAAPGAAAAGASGRPVKTADPKANILTAKIPNLKSGEIPIIAVTTQAPDEDAAARLANESVGVLQAHLRDRRRDRQGARRPPCRGQAARPGAVRHGVARVRRALWPSAPPSSCSPSAAWRSSASSRWSTAGGAPPSWSPAGRRRVLRARRGVRGRRMVRRTAASCPRAVHRGNGAPTSRQAAQGDVIGFRGARGS